MKHWLIWSFLLSCTPALSAGQTMYKCPDPSGVVKFQQMPCSPTGGGEAVPIKQVPGSGEGLRPGEAQILSDLAAQNAAIAQARADAEEKAHQERKREEALNIERSKAEAQWETAHAIWAIGRRR